MNVFSKIKEEKKDFQLVVSGVHPAFFSTAHFTCLFCLIHIQSSSNTSHGHEASELLQAAIQPLAFLISNLCWLKVRDTSGVNIILLTTAGDSETHKHTDMRIKMWNFIYSKFKENEIQTLKLISQLGACLSSFKNLFWNFPFMSCREAWSDA